MNVILIDPFNRSVIKTAVEADFSSICELIGAARLEFAYAFETGDVLYVNGDGLARAEDAMLGRDEGEHAFAFDVGAHQPFFGKGVVVGPADSEGRHGPVLMDPSRLSGIVFLLPRVAAPDAGGHAAH